MPLFSTPTQFAVLGLLLIAGWLFGLASHPGGRKWKARYLAERDANAGVRREGEARAVAAEKRVVELERENARLAKVQQPVVAPVAAQPMTSRPVVAQPVSTRATYPAGERRGWFDFNR